ncbi:MAG: hypothetical protein ABI760_24740 [Ferruginibacter sp.]
MMTFGQKLRDEMKASIETGKKLSDPLAMPSDYLAGDEDLK